jgi:preprotein translocase subunit SecY
MSLLEQFGNVWRIKDLRRKLLITLGLLSLCRVGVYIPLPGINVEALGALFQRVGQGAGGQVLGLINMFAGGAMRNGAIFGLGIMPYISSSIIFTLLAQVVPSLEALRKEGQAGQRKLNQYTRVATVFICLFQGAILVRGLYSFQNVVPDAIRLSGAQSFKFMLTSGLLLMCGTMFLMWLGEQIDAHGIGNGISLIITANILARMPAAVTQVRTQMLQTAGQQSAVMTGAVLLALFVVIVGAVVYITMGERRIPVQQQRYVRGPRVYGAQKHYLPLRVNQAGVMPIIFAQSLLMFPALIARSLAQALSSNTQSFWYKFFDTIASATTGTTLTFTYVVLYGAMIFLFCYFWTAVTFNPKDMSENLQNYGSFIPGIRPGKRTADYLEGIMNRVTMAGSFFLVIIALLPLAIATGMKVDYRIAAFYGGTGILIVVGVCLDLVRRVNEHLEMRRYSGFGAGAGGRRRSRRR